MEFKYTPFKFITDFTYRGRNFYLGTYGIDTTTGNPQYVGIDEKYVKDGKLTQTLNGLQMHMRDSSREVIESIKNTLDLEFYMEQGMSRLDSMMKVFNIPEENREQLSHIITD